jgi:hypothetical protein
MQALTNVLCVVLFEGDAIEMEPVFTLRAMYHRAPVIRAATDAECRLRFHVLSRARRASASARLRARALRARRHG